MPRPGPARGARGRRVRREAGQATAELALLLPLLAVLALGLVQGGLVVRDQVLVVHAARDAVRAVSVGTDHARVRESVERVLPGARVGISGGGSIGAEVTVEVVYRSATTLPVVGALAPDPELRARVTMRAER